jgi:hypothetical protein
MIPSRISIDFITLLEEEDIACILKNVAAAAWFHLKYVVYLLMLEEWCIVSPKPVDGTG